MHRPPQKLLWVVSVVAGFGFLFPGCATFLTGGRTQNYSGGQTYYLPKYCIIAQPLKSGSVMYNELYIPDPGNEYSLDVFSIISKYSLDVEQDNGLLTKITLKGESDAVAAETVKAFGEIEKSRTEARAKEEAADQAAVDAAKKTVATAQENVDKATLELKAAMARLEKLKQIGTKDQIIQQELTVVDKEAALEEAERILAREEDKFRRVQRNGAADSPDAAAGDSESQKVAEAYGSVLYCLEQWIDADGVPDIALRAVEIKDKDTLPEASAQRTFAAPGVAGASASTPGNRYLPSSAMASPSTAGYEVKLTSNEALDRVTVDEDGSPIRPVGNPSVQSGKILTIQRVSATEISFTLPKIESGSYLVDIKIAPSALQPPDLVKEQVTVVVP
jgi:hypothetical protein